MLPKFFAFNQFTVHQRAIVALVLVNAMWGASFPIMKCLNLQMDGHFGVDETSASSFFRTASSAWMISIRFGIALLLLVLILPKTLRRIGRPELLGGIAIGTFFFLGLLLQVMGLATIPASRSGFLTSLVVIVTPIFSTILRRRLPRFMVLAGAIVALLGVTILTGIVGIENGRFGIAADALARWRIGDTFTLLATLFFSTQILLVDSLGKRYDSVGFTPSMFATTSLLAAMVFAFLQPHIPEVSPRGWGGLAIEPRFFLLVGVLCVFPSLIAFSLMNRFQPLVTASQAAVIYTLEPLCASAWAMVVPGVLSVLCSVAYSNEEFTIGLAIGGAMVLSANGLALWPDRQRA